MSALTTSDLRPVTPKRRPMSWGQTALHSIILLLLVLSLVPTYLMLELSFKNAIQYRYERWLISFPLRIANYPSAWDIVGGFMLNTILVAAIGLCGVLILSLIGGYIFSRMSFPFNNFLYYAIIALLMIPSVLSFIPSYMMYNSFGLLDTRAVLIIPNLAGGQVFGIFLLRALIAGIPEELYEAARVDGAGLGTLIGRITLPLSLPGLATLAVLNFLGTWNSFLWPLLTIRKNELQVISVGLFKLSRTIQGGIDYGVWGPMYAGYVLASVPLVLLFAVLGRFYVEGLVDSGIKI